MDFKCNCQPFQCRHIHFSAQLILILSQPEILWVSLGILRLFSLWHWRLAIPKTYLTCCRTLTLHYVTLFLNHLFLLVFLLQSLTKCKPRWLTPLWTLSYMLPVLLVFMCSANTSVKKSKHPEIKTQCWVNFKTEGLWSWNSVYNDTWTQCRSKDFQVWNSWTSSIVEFLGLHRGPASSL